jgi:YbbR domain-containing protein
MAYISFRHHLGLKFVSIALAALLWVAVAGEQTVERSLRIPLEFTNLPSQLEVVGDAPTVVDVRVRGSSGALNRIASGELVAVLDLRSARSGQRLFHLGGTDVRTPFGVDVVQVNPSTVSMLFEPSGSKTVPVVPTVEGEPADGFVVGTVTAEPPTVEVLGPISVLSKLTQAITEPVTVTDASAPLTETVNIGVADTSVRLRTPQTARVAVVVTPAPVEWSVGDIAVKPLNAQGRVQVVPGRVTAWVRGPREAMTSDGTMFDATVDVEGLKTGDFQLPVMVVAPQRVGVVRLEPAEVKVRVR